MSKLFTAELKSLELLSHLVSYGDALVTVSGPVGSGKTFLANMLAAHREEPEETCIVTADVATGVGAILSEIAVFFDLPAVVEDSMLSRKLILEEAQQRKDSDIDTLVIIDQVEYLDEDTLVELVAFISEVQSLISFALIGLPGFEETVNQVAEASPYNHYMEPLDHEESLSLLEHMLGEETVAQLPDKVLKKILIASEGWPGRIIELADKELSQTDGRKASLGRFLPIANVIAVAAIASLLIVLMLYNDSDEQVTTVSSDAENSEVEQPAKPLSQPIVEESVISLAEEAEELNVLEVASFTAQQISEKPAANGNDSLSKKDTRDVDAQIEYNQQNYAPLVEENPSKGSDPEESVNEVKPASQPPIDDKEAQDLTTQYVGDEAELLSIKEGFAIQLMGSRSLNGAQTFKSNWQPRVTGKLFLYEASLQGKAWYVVVNGVFDTRDQANAMKKRLPAELLSSSPWVRPIDQVHEAIR